MVPAPAAMQYLRLKPHVSFAMVEGKPVFLDLERDRYFMLGPAAADAFDRLRRDPGAGLSRARDAAPLLDTGLFTQALEGSRLNSPEVDAPRREAGQAGRARPRLADIVEVAILLSRAGWAIRREPVARLLGRHLQRKSSSLPAGAEPDIERLSARFRAARSWAPARASCLRDSLALGDWLARRSASAQLIFGVKLDPFAAHCWVQHEGVVLNDAPDRVAHYVPILVI